MPELPEVEVVRRGLEEHLRGGVIHDVDVRHPRAVRAQPGGAAELVSLLDGARIQSFERRGKYMWLVLDSGHALFVHLGMSGQMLIHEAADTALPTTHVRIRARVDVGVKELVLSFVDQRTFGQWQVTPVVTDPHGGFTGVPVPVAHIAPDPFEAVFDPVVVARRLRAKKTDVKRALLDQTLVSGIGNIYADEALWAAGVAPGRRTRGMRQRDAVAVLEQAEAVMRRALAQGGTSFDSLYVNVNGASGYFSRSLNAYGRTGKPCPRCGEPIVRVQWTNRSSHFCPQCQPS
ncbi:bifunctional DNA-formamidopyrimidine glycosylase/DNA-(apurinic or apyrimidinic site) lyase [Corynebacterium sp. UMB4614]|uniref:bifunctional DNA-formamidopyrimidine glycosylase/DNA-(apurinic or apyrimidinic site) lyase n=1 Tax=Corynebacterium sp. UMB4614 TaxID=3046334 RepID=UPI002549F02E|nr:bifunctional DNA-formamidopyrimidine glycosylase/DNA-(apurinic or apyrimidinic site) lyase [Corynebacterium sp. UMB4614]MDK7135242.1 bifunctional DNA-formamidopyrimidine glycosylase/DNA-(apurinic or apyrimidinic site) lyase [Corynebacterium sp. UMB4614]